MSQLGPLIGSKEAIYLERALGNAIEKQEISEQDKYNISKAWMEVDNTDSSDLEQVNAKFHAKLKNIFGPRSKNISDLVNRRITLIKEQVEKKKNEMQQQSIQQNVIPQHNQYQQQPIQQQNHNQYSQHPNNISNNQYQGGIQMNHQKGISQYQPFMQNMQLNPQSVGSGMQNSTSSMLPGLLLQNPNMYSKSGGHYQQPYSQNATSIQMQNNIHHQQQQLPNNNIQYHKNMMPNNIQYQPSAVTTNFMLPANNLSQQSMMGNITMPQQNISSNNLLLSMSNINKTVFQTMESRIEPMSMVTIEEKDKKKKKAPSKKASKTADSSSPDNLNTGEEGNTEEKKTSKKKQPYKSKGKSNDEDEDIDAEEGGDKKKLISGESVDNNKSVKEPKEKKIKPKKSPEEIEDQKRIAALKKKEQSQKNDNIASNNSNNNDINDENKGVDFLLERTNIMAEGMEVISSKSITAPVFSNNFIQDEASLSKKQLRIDIANITNKKDEFLNPPPGYEPDLEPGQEWQFYNIMDKVALDEITNSSLKSRDFTISKEALTYLSNGLQVFLKNAIESAVKICKTRVCKLSIVSLNFLNKLISSNKGEATHDNRKNIGLKFGPDNRSFLDKSENNSRKYIAEMNKNDEIELQEEMKAHDEKYLSAMSSSQGAGGKRKLQNSDGNNELIEVPWWTKEESAEKSGVLNLVQISETQFKRNIAEKYSLGLFNNEIVSKRPKLNKNMETINRREISNNDNNAMEVDTNHEAPLSSSRISRSNNVPLIINSHTAILVEDINSSFKSSNTDYDSKIISRVRMDISF